MNDDNLEFSVDPYDLLQEHDLLIQRLIKSNNAMQHMLEQLAQQNEDLAHQLLIMSEYIKK